MTAKAIDIELADAVLAELNAAPGPVVGPPAGAGTFCQAFTAERIYLGTPDLADITGIRVSVVPSESDDTFASRAAIAEEVKINIGIRKKLTASPADLAAYTEELDGLRLLTFQIKRYLESPAHRRLSTMADAMLTQGAQNRPIFVPEHLTEMNQYTSIIILTYTVTRV